MIEHLEFSWNSSPETDCAPFQTCESDWSEGQNYKQHFIYFNNSDISSTLADLFKDTIIRWRYTMNMTHQRRCSMPSVSKYPQQNLNNKGQWKLKRHYRSECQLKTTHGVVTRQVTPTILSPSLKIKKLSRIVHAWGSARLYVAQWRRFVQYLRQDKAWHQQELLWCPVQGSLVQI